MKTTINTIGAFIRFILFMSLLTYALNSKAQSFSVGGGIGVLDTSGFAVQLKIQYEYKFIGLTTGFICAPKPSEPCVFDIQVFTPICLSYNSRLVPKFGFAYKLVSNDNKSRNQKAWISGISFEQMIVDKGIIYMDAIFMQHKRFAFTLGMRGIFN